MNKAIFSIPIVWRTVVGLAGVQSAITLMWLMYRLFLPSLLQRWGFDASFTTSVLILEGILGSLFEPLFGGLSDRQKYLWGTRFPLIMVGVVLSSSLFIIIPVTTLFPKPNSFLVIFLPILAVIWALAMTLFRSPILALLGQTAPTSALPLANSLLICWSGIVSAFNPIISKEIVKNLDPLLIFLMGSVVLVFASVYLQWVSSPPQPSSEDQGFSPYPTLFLLVFFILGITVAFGLRGMMGSVNTVVKIPSFMLGLGLFSAIIVLPLGWIASRWSNDLILLISSGFLLLSGFALLTGQSVIQWGGIIILIMAVTAVNNGVIPLILSLVSSQRAGLGIGMYFGGFGLGMALFNVFFPNLALLQLSQQILIGEIAFLLVSLLFFLLSKPKKF